jgi:hypothetical protein
VTVKQSTAWDKVEDGIQALLQQTKGEIAPTLTVPTTTTTPPQAYEDAGGATSSQQADLLDVARPKPTAKSKAKAQMKDRSLDQVEGGKQPTVKPKVIDGQMKQPVPEEADSLRPGDVVFQGNVSFQ